jgi:hypothetical protein
MSVWGEGPSELARTGEPGPQAVRVGSKVAFAAGLGAR